MTDRIKRLVQSGSFQVFVLGMIVLAAVLVGLETYPSIAGHPSYGSWLRILNTVVLWVFVIEAALKMAQHGRRFYDYFRDPWNVFDFTIVVVCFLPVNASYAAVLRLARIMRALRLMTALPQLQVIVGALIKSIPSMVYVGILLTLNFYVYAVMGVFLFGKNDPVHFQDLPTSMLSLFRVVTLEDWTDVMYINMHGVNRYPGLENYVNHTGIQPDPSTCPGPLVGGAFFVSFVMFGTMIMLNLFIGVILNSMEEARAERERAEIIHDRSIGKALTIDHEIALIDHHLDELKDRLHALRVRLAMEAEEVSSGAGNA